MRKRQLSITSKKSVGLRLKVHNMLFTVHITFIISIIWKRVRNYDNVVVFVIVDISQLIKGEISKRTNFKE